MIQLPNDVVSTGYKQVKPYEWRQVFYSPKHDFTGTEEEFVKAGFGYCYVQLDNYRRQVIL